MSVSSGARKRSEQGGAIKGVSPTSEQANGRASGPVLTSGFLIILDNSGLEYGSKKKVYVKNKIRNKVYDGD